jgi:hypothetical protein
MTSKELLPALVYGQEIKKKWEGRLLELVGRVCGGCRQLE